MRVSTWRRQSDLPCTHKAAVVWFTGLPGSGKTTLARGLRERLSEAGCRTALLDGDALRAGLCSDLGFSERDRAENVRRAGAVARLLFDNGDIVLCAFISPHADHRAAIRAQFPTGRFVEVFVDCPVDECARRDPKGLYARASRGEVQRLTGVSDPYERPAAPEYVARTHQESVQSTLDALMRQLRNMEILMVRATAPSVDREFERRLDVKTG